MHHSTVLHTACWFERPPSARPPSRIVFLTALHPRRSAAFVSHSQWQAVRVLDTADNKTTALAYMRHCRRQQRVLCCRTAARPAHHHQTVSGAAMAPLEVMCPLRTDTLRVHHPAPERVPDASCYRLRLPFSPTSHHAPTSPAGASGHFRPPVCVATDIQPAARGDRLRPRKLGHR
jgi:hypothetical protein